MIAAAILPLAAGSIDKAIALAGVLALLVGLICVVAAVVRLGFVACADLVVGFVASMAGNQTIMLGAALIAGAVGGPVFWLWQGLRLWRDA